ncbi:MAG: family 2 glycosyl transferase [Desulfobulbaceae bacterium BRH_c16a]|nr:MAG: family 2 glycosyl transferase [Desulfobulbaceae bacterium BRH_c16a]
MKISIITVCFNSVETLANTIESVASQMYQDTEYLIVDGGSEDGSVEIIRSNEAKLDRWVSEPDDGIYDAMNKGLSMSTGDIVGFINSDDVYADSNALGQVAEVFVDPSVDACYADLVYVKRDNLQEVVRYCKSCEYQDGLFEKGWCPPHPTFFVKKDIFEKMGNFELSYSMGNDVELMMRFLARYKIESRYIPKILVKMRMGGESNRSLVNVVKQNVEILRAGKSNGIKISVPFFLMTKIISRVAQYQAKRKAIERFKSMSFPRQ